VIYRCTARFIKSYDQLAPEARDTVARMLRQGFNVNPRMPTADTHLVRGAQEEVHTLKLADHLHMTFAYVSDPRHAEDFVCVLRNVGRIA
jgi:hypothetical protein